MISDLMDATRRVGLEMHMGRTKVMHNGRGPGNTSASMEVRGQKIGIVDAAEYSGRNHRFSKA